MYLQEILEVAIGLVFMWLIISLAAMQLQEWIANWLKWRAKGLEDAIRSMLGGGQEGQMLTEMLYQHPLIVGLSSSTHKKLSYIPADKFALALFDIVTEAGTEAWPVKHALEDVKAQLASMSNPEEKKLAADDFEALLAAAKQLAGTQLGESAVDSLKLQIQNFGEKNPDLRPAIELALPQVDSYYKKIIEEQRKVPLAERNKDLTLHQIRLGLLAMESVYPNTKKALNSLLTGVEERVNEGEQALARGLKQVETWFDDSMARLSGWYKRRAQFVAFAIGVVLAIFLDIDSINAATMLWREPTLRQAIITQIDTYIQQYQETPAPTQTPIPGAADETPTTGTPTQTTVDPAKVIADLKDKLTVLNIPFGWSTAAFDTNSEPCYIVPFVPNTAWGIPSKDAEGNAICKRFSNLPVDTTGWLAKIVGLLMTGAAAAQGAPFWFDILKKLINVRSSGPNPSEKPAG